MSQPKSLMMMPWFPRDFMSSTRGWPLIARAAYRELLDAQWDMETLPASSDELRAIVGATDQEWSVAWPKVQPKFPLSGDGRKNPKLEEHRAKARTLHAQRALGAQLANAQRDAQRTHPSPSPSPSPSPEPNQTKEETKIGAPRRAQPQESDGFAAIRKAYPRRGGGQRWGDAEAGYRKAIGAGELPESILAGVERYALHIRAQGKEGTEYVQQAGTFFGRNQAWREPWELVKQRKELSAVERVKLAGEAQNERVVSTQHGKGFEGLDLIGSDVRHEVRSGLRRIGS